ncbi:efflux RND transporter permease subunit [endosymbiont of unidentified scaly snail isolate Monju]|uniref:efflux RND transporter permease subunit n=1 Tax=endosymbiont of unidentified scaly snail isolate Monju TaxID=1248727 RepID=UPI000389220C|nr:efflux RND transporter permease subunit [endosymbiont of unidentified scaly snail isolate Monju]BAN69022.1 RND superfamily efflux transporter [endosymbiont of unidentified scaly snail isolate Monju]
MTGTDLFEPILCRPWRAILASLLGIVLLGAGIPRLTFSNDYRMFFGEDNVHLRAFEQLQNTYTKDDTVLFVVAPRDGRVFSRRVLDDLVWLTEQAWQTPYSIRVDSITNFQHTEAEGDDLRVADLVEAPAGMVDAELARVRQIALTEPLLRNRLISPDARVTGVNVTIQLPGEAVDEPVEVMRFARELKARLLARDPDLEVYLTGVLPLNAAFAEASQHDMKTLYPAMFAVIMVVLALMLRSLVSMLAVMGVIALTVIGTLGAAGWLDFKLSPPTVSVPIMVMTLAVADCVHILVNFLHERHEGVERREAMRQSLRINLAPVFLTTLTTAIGYLSLNFSKVPPFRDLGNMAAMGVGIALVLALVFLPAVMQLLPVRAARQDAASSRLMERLADFVIARRQALFWGMSLVVVVLVAQVPRNELNDEFVKYFDESIPFRQAAEFATEHLTGIYRIQYSVPARDEGGVADPDYLRHLEAFAQWYRQQPEVLHVNVLTDTMKRLNKSMHGDDPARYRLPDRRDLAAQYLLLYEFSLPFGLDLNNQINVRKSASRMTVTLRNVSSNELLALERRAAEWMRDNLPAHMQAVGSSPAVMFSHIGATNIRFMLEGTVVALVLISLILVGAFRSLRLGLLSLVPNMVPMGMAFGVWGLFVGQVGLAMSVVSGMTLGIVVDDTVHFMSKYLRARREQGLDGPAAVRYAFSTVGKALWVTTLGLALGFMVLAFSGFELNSGMGILTTLTIVLALVADFLYLPVLLLKFGDSPDATPHTVDPA